MPDPAAPPENPPENPPADPPQNPPENSGTKKRGRPRKPRDAAGKIIRQPAAAPEKVISDAEKKAAQEAAVEKERRRKLALQNKCISCGAFLRKDGTCKCGVRIENGRQVARDPKTLQKSPQPPKPEPPKRGFFETIFQT